MSARPFAILAGPALVLMLMLAVLNDGHRPRGERKLVGDYTQWLALEMVMTLRLKNDGRFISEFYGCFGCCGTARGRWFRNGNRLHFSVADEDGVLKGQLTTAAIVDREGHSFLVLAEDRDDAEKAGLSSRTCFYKRQSIDVLFFLDLEKKGWTEWKPISRVDLMELYQAEYADLDERLRSLMDQYALDEPWKAGLRRSGLPADEFEYVFVVARHRDSVLYFDDLEDGFAFAHMSQGRCITEPGKVYSLLHSAVSDWLSR